HSEELTLRKAVVIGERQAGIAEVPTPQAKGDWALVKVHVAPMCTEYKAFLSGEKAEYLGHEAAGEVVAVDKPGRVKVGDRVGAIVNAVYRGARPIVVESEPYRVARAKELGAAAALDPRDPDVVSRIRSLTGGRGADKSLDCSGVVPAERLCIDATRRRGDVA